MNPILGLLFFIAICAFLTLYQFVGKPAKKPRPRVFSVDIVDGKPRNVKEWGREDGRK